MSELGDKRELFTRCIYLLLQKMYADGMRPRFDKEHCNHMKNSLHYDGLAKDILLFDKDNVYLTDTDSYRKYGIFWETLNKDCTWGGHFSDGNHFSITFQGRK
jgi:hypothetical protein